MALEKWAAIASWGLFAMFVGEMISVYHFMIEPPGELELGIVFEADPKILQFISIGVAPALILAAVSYILSRRYGSKQNGGLIVGGGATMFVGMLYCYTLLEKVEGSFVTDAVNIVPALFMAVSIAVIVVGLKLFKTKKRRPKKEYF